MSGKPIVIYTAANLPQAHMLRNVLEDLGIAATITNDAIQLAVGDVPAGWSTAPRVVVDEQYGELARRVAVEFDAGSRESGPQDTSHEEAESKHPRETVAWPSCPKCRARRQAVCSYCGASGDDMSPADLTYQTVEAAGAERPAAEVDFDEPSTVSWPDWLICPTCEEPFAIEYERNCADCGHVFADGVARPEAPPAMLFSVTGLFRLVIGLTATALLLLWKPVMGVLLLLIVVVGTVIRRSLDAEF